jgi:hypothetical protein
MKDFGLLKMTSKYIVEIYPKTMRKYIKKRDKKSLICLVPALNI